MSTQSQAVSLRNALAERLAGVSVERVAHTYLRARPSDMRRLAQYVTRDILGSPLIGSGVDLGAGTGLFGAYMATAVHRLYSLDVCERLAELVIPRVGHYVLGSSAHRMVPVVASFEAMPFADSSLDFAVEYNSLHHSTSLLAVLTEVARVLRTGGCLVCVDKVRPDAWSDALIDKKLSHVYTPAELRWIGYPDNIHLTRRQNGEREYREHEWRAGLSEAGFHVGRLVRAPRSVSRGRPMMVIVARWR